MFWILSINRVSTKGSMVRSHIIAWMRDIWDLGEARKAASLVVGQIRSWLWGIFCPTLWRNCLEFYETQSGIEGWTTLSQLQQRWLEHGSNWSINSGQQLNYGRGWKTDICVSVLSSKGYIRWSWERNVFRRAGWVHWSPEASRCDHWPLRSCLSSQCTYPKCSWARGWETRGQAGLTISLWKPATFST